VYLGEWRAVAPSPGDVITALSLAIGSGYSGPRRRQFSTEGKAPAVEDAQKVIDDLHPEDRATAGSRAIFLPGSPPSPEC